MQPEYQFSLSEATLSMPDTNSSIYSPPPLYSPGASAQLKGQQVQIPAQTEVKAAPPEVPEGPIEMCYVTDEAGIIVSLDDDLWNLFIADNCDVPLPTHIARCQFPTIVGRNLFEFIGDAKIQTFFRHIIYMLITGMQTKFVYHWFCDSPTHERKMSMVVTKLAISPTQRLILWRSSILRETALKPAQTYLCAPALPVAPAEMIETKPVRTVCTYCKRILVSWNEVQSPEKVLNLITQLDGPTIDEEYLSEGKNIPIIGYRGKCGQQYSSTGKVTHLWLSAKQYYGTFLDDNIIINHGICELCYEEFAMLFMPPGTFQQGERVVPAQV